MLQFSTRFLWLQRGVSVLFFIFHIPPSIRIGCILPQQQPPTFLRKIERRRPAGWYWCQIQFECLMPDASKSPSTIGAVGPVVDMSLDRHVQNRPDRARAVLPEHERMVLNA